LVLDREVMIQINPRFSSASLKINISYRAALQI
jgi:hypothetical protein